MLTDESSTYIGTSKNQIPVYYDPINSHAATHINDTPELKSLVREVLALIDLNDEKELVEHDMGRVVGKTDLLETSDNDNIIYAKRVNRDNYTRFVLGRSPVDTSKVTLILFRRDESTYVLHSAWIGLLAPTFPGSDAETPESFTYWKAHALAWGNQAIQPDTETTIQPW